MSIGRISLFRRPLGRSTGLRAKLWANPRRQLSSTPAHCTPIRAMFTETDCQPLNDALAKIRDQYILPAHLPAKQRNIVFDPSQHAALQENPIVIEVDGYEHKFNKTLDRIRNREDTKLLFKRATRLMTTTAHWSNLPTLMAGYKKAGIVLHADNFASAVRMAGLTGNVSTIIDCVQQSGKTGFMLQDLEVIVQLFRAVNQKITSSKWDKDHTFQALAWVKVLLDVMHMPDHAMDGCKPFYNSRVVRGEILFAVASAVKVQRAINEPVESDLVFLKDEVQALNTLWSGNLPEDLGELSDFYPLNVLKNRSHTALSGSTYVEVMAQLIKAIEMAQEIVGHEAKVLLQVRDRLVGHVREFALKAPGRQKSKWNAIYVAVTGRHLEGFQA